MFKLVHRCTEQNAPRDGKNNTHTPTHVLRAVCRVKKKCHPTNCWLNCESVRRYVLWRLLEISIRHFPYTRDSPSNGQRWARCTRDGSKGRVMLSITNDNIEWLAVPSHRNDWIMHGRTLLDNLFALLLFAANWLKSWDGSGTLGGMWRAATVKDVCVRWKTQTNA